MNAENEEMIMQKIEDALDDPKVKMSDFFKQLKQSVHTLSNDFQTEMRYLSSFPIVINALQTENNELIGYFKKRVEKSNTYTGKAVYNELVFRLDKDFQAAVNALEAYTRTVQDLIGKKNYERAIWLFHRICIIADETKNEKAIIKLLPLIQSVIKEIYQTQPLNISGRLRTSLMTISRYLSPEFITYFVNVTEEFFETIEEKQASYIERVLIPYIAFLRELKCNQLNQNLRRYITICEKLGDYYLAESTIPNASFLASHFYQRGLKFATENGLTSRLDILKTKIIKANQKMDFSEFTASTTIDTKAVVEEFKIEAKKQFGDHTEPYLKYFASLHQYIPSLLDFNQEIDAEQQAGIGIGRLLFPTTVYIDDLPVGTFDSLSDEGREYQTKQRMVQYSLWFEITLTILLESFIKEKLSVKRLFEFITQSPYISAEKYPFMLNGLTLHFAGDYIGSIHVLLPQIERLIRELILTKYPETTVHVIESNGIRMLQKMLGVINTPEARGIFDERFCNFVSTNLVDPVHRNLRNRFLHGLAEPEECNQAVSTFLIWIIVAINDYSLKLNLENHSEMNK